MPETNPTTPASPHESNKETKKLAADIRQQMVRHFERIGIDPSTTNGTPSKQEIRDIQSHGRTKSAKRETALFKKKGKELICHFAAGQEIDPHAIDPEIIFIESPNSEEGHLFRFATLLWSVPVSRGFGRRMRFLIRDRSNEKLIGILALGSPVFNLSDRDEWIGWSVEDRKERLVNVMDAYVLGAMPPYSRLLGGKLIGALAGASEIRTRFKKRYGHRRSVSGKVKKADLVLITTTSALGRSSIYNRLRLKGIIEYKRIGWTKGWGHFHIPDAIFSKMRDLLERNGHKYASGHSFGDGPNWRIRVIREALERVGLDGNLLRHGIKREVFGVPLADNWREYLCGVDNKVTIDRPSARHITEVAKQRWIIARAKRCPDYKEWTRQDTWKIIRSRFEQPAANANILTSSNSPATVEEKNSHYKIKRPVPQTEVWSQAYNFLKESNRSPVFSDTPFQAAQ